MAALSAPHAAARRNTLKENSAWSRNSRRWPTSKNASGAGLFDSALAGSVKESAQEIWLAGMGAFAKAQAEGKQVFEALVKEGSSLQKKTQGVAEEKFGEVTSKMTSMADDVTAKAGQHWDKLETIFEERTAKALKQARRADREGRAGPDGPRRRAQRPGRGSHQGGRQGRLGQGRRRRRSARRPRPPPSARRARPA